jgi:hypothetical protein
MVEWIVVPFEGEGAGVGGLTWGQQQVWRAMVEVGTSMSMGGVVPVTDGRDVADIAEELRFLISRYAALRTRLIFDEPWHATSIDACHLVRQETAARGEAVLEVHDTSPGEDPAAVAAAVFTAWKARNFDYTGEWPIREAVVRRDGAVTHLVVLVCHVAADGSGLATMIRELAERDPVTKAARRPYTAMQPLELAAAQRTAQRQTDTAMRQWEAQLRSIRPRRFPAAVDRGEPRWRQVVWRSAALMLAAERVAASLGTDTAPVPLAAYGAAFNTATGQTAPFATQVIVGNRFRPGLADVVNPLTQNGLVVFDLDGVTALEAIGRARRASMNASKHAYYEPVARLALLERIGRLHGEPVDLAVFYNDRRVGVMQAPERLDAVPTDADIRAALPLTEVLAETPMVFFNEKLMVNVDDAAGTVQLTVEVDTHHLAIEDLHRLLAAMESFTVAAAAACAAPAASPLDQAVAST